jgi:inosose dehydratase
MHGLSTDRRDFLRRLAGLGQASGVASLLRDGPPEVLQNPVGYATIAWPDEEFSQALETISKLGFKGVQMLGWVSETYGGSKTATLRKRLKDLRLEPATLSCSSVNLDPAKPEDETPKVRSYAGFFRDLGGLYLQVNDSGLPDKQYSSETIRALGDQMNAMGKIARDFGLKLGYHPHFGTIGETREGLGRMLEATDPTVVNLIADVAHLTLGGADPAEVIRTYHDRLILTHFKDVRKDVAALARKDRKLVRKSEYYFCEVGEGAVNYAAILDASRAVNFTGWVIFELDSYQMRPGGPAMSARMDQTAARKMGFRV